MDNFLKGWMASEESQLDKIEVKRIYIDICNGNMYDAVLLSQIMYWHRNSRETGLPRLKVNRGGHLWLVKSHGDWMAECRIKESTAKQCLSRLEKLGLIIREYHRFNGLRTSHIRVDYDVLSKLIQSHITERHNISDRKDIIYPTEQTQYIRPITETTTKTTTETKELPSSDGVPKKPTTPFDELTDSDKVLAIIDAWVEQRYAHNTPVAGKPHNNKTNKAGAKQLIALGLEPRHVKAYVKHLQDTDVWYEDHAVEFKKVIETCKLWVDKVLKEHAEKSASERPAIDPPPKEIVIQWVDDGCTRQDMINMMCAVGVTQTQAEKTLDDYGVSA